MRAVARQVDIFDSLARVAQPGVNRQAIIRQLVGGVPVTSVGPIILSVLCLAVTAIAPQYVQVYEIAIIIDVLIRKI
jgi:hypothetical protein